MRTTTAVVLIVGLCLVIPAPAPSLGATRPRATATQSPDTLGAIVDAVADVVPLGREAVRDVVREILTSVTITPDEERALGEQFFAEIKGRLGDRLDRDRREVAYIGTIGKRVAAGAARKNVRYRFHVVEDDQVNAFAIPGGHVFVYRGLLAKAIENEAQLANVLGHEIAHIDAGHTTDFLKPIKAASQFPLADVSVLVATLASKMLSTAASEAQESEADSIGTVLAFRAGYEPAEGAAVHKKLAALSPSGAPDPVTGLADSLLRTHPPSARRAAAIAGQARQLHEREPGRRTVVGVDNFRRRSPAALAR